MREFCIKDLVSLTDSDNPEWHQRIQFAVDTKAGQGKEKKQKEKSAVESSLHERTSNL